MNSLSARWLNPVCNFFQPHHVMVAAHAAGGRSLEAGNTKDITRELRRAINFNYLYTYVHWHQRSLLLIFHPVSIIFYLQPKTVFTLSIQPCLTLLIHSIHTTHPFTPRVQSILTFSGPFYPPTLFLLQLSYSSLIS